MSSSVNVSGLSWRLNRSPEIKTLSKTETTHFSQAKHMRLHFLLGYDKCKIKGKFGVGEVGGLVILFISLPPTPFLLSPPCLAHHLVSRDQCCY